MAWRYLQIAAPGETLAAGGIQASVEHADVWLRARRDFRELGRHAERGVRLLQRSALYSAAYQFRGHAEPREGTTRATASGCSFPLLAGYGERDLTQQSLRELARSQARFWPDGHVNAVYPNGDGKRDMPDFTEMYVIWALRYYEASGDLSLLGSSIRCWSRSPIVWRRHETRARASSRI